VKFGSRCPPVHGSIASRIVSAWDSTPGTSAMPTMSSDQAASREEKALSCSPPRVNAPPSCRSSTSTCGEPEPGPVWARKASRASVGKSVSTAAASYAGVGSSGSVCTESMAVYGFSATSSSRIGADPRISANRRSPSSGSPVQT
jgi:hypothetical protein